MRKAFNHNNLVGGDSVLTADTISRRNTIFPQYQNSIKLNNLSKSELESTTVIKRGILNDELWMRDEELCMRNNDWWMMNDEYWMMRQNDFKGFKNIEGIGIETFPKF